MSLKPYLAAATTALILVGASGATAATTISSTFDDGDDGWRYGSYQHTSTQDVVYDPETGTIFKEAGLAGWGFVAPTAYLGDKTDYVGGELSFDLATSRVSYKERPFVILKGSNGKQIFSRLVGGPTPELATYKIRLTAASFYTGHIGGQSGDVSQDLFNDIMADLETLEILGDWNASRDFSRLDNVFLTSAAVPEPGAWALMITGAGMAGTMLRLRRRLRVA